MQLFRSSNKPTIPRLVIKNTLLFAVSQAFQGIPMQMAVTTGASMVAYLTGSKALAGVPGMLISGSRFIVAFPTGYLTDRYGRKTGMYMSLILGLIACLILTSSTYSDLTYVMFLGFIVLGLGFGANTQLRVAAADMYPAKLRASGIGTVLTFSVFGAFLSPLLISLANTIEIFALDELTKIWGLIPLFLLPVFLFVYLIKHKNQIILKKGKNTKFLRGLMEIPNNLLNSKTSLKIAKKNAPLELDWKIVPGKLNSKISNFELEIRFFKAQVKQKFFLKNAIWVNKSEIQKIPISTLMKNILSYLNPA